MKNYLIGLLVVSLALLGSFYYKASEVRILNGFPIEEQVAPTPNGEPPLYLFIFFSRNNCNVCMEAVQVLNKLHPPFVVTGIIPGEELVLEADFRRATTAEFKLIAFNKTYQKLNPHYAPTVFGVSANGYVLFVLPAVPEQKTYLYNFLTNFYGRSI